MFTVDVISEPSALIGPERASSHVAELKQMTAYDLSLVKPALLFADKVNLVSYRLDIQAQVVSDAFRNSRMPMRFVLAYAGLTWRNIEEEREHLGMPRNMMCTQEDAESLFREKFDIAAIAAFEEKYADGIWLYRQLFAKVLREQRDALIGDELDLAVKKDVLDCSAWHIDMPSPFALSWTEVQEMFIPEAVRGLVNRLATTTGTPLLEPNADAQLKNLLGRKKSAKITRRDAALRAPVAVAVASGITSSLPGLNELSISEIIDLRSSLHNYLPAFRASMIELSEEIARSTDSDPSSLAPEIDLHWNRDIAPVLQEIEREVSNARYPRKLLSAFASDKSVMAGTASAVVLAAGSVFAGAGTLIPAAAAAAFPFIKALNDTLHSRDDVRKNKLYFLYAVQDRIQERH